VPAAAIDPSLIVHVGDGKYCRIHLTGDLWVCSQELSTGGGSGTGTPDPTSAEKQAYGASHQPDPCKGGPKI
jgi:hypothetical protein